MGRKEPTHLVVGVINKPHGVNGEVLVRPLTDHPGGIFAPGVVLLPGPRDGDGPDPDRPPLRVDQVRDFKDAFLVHFGGVRDRNDADELRGLYLHVEREAVAPLQEGEVFHYQLLGMRVETVAGEEVGTVQEVYELSPSDLIEVRTPRGSLLIPFHADVVVEVDAEGGRLVVDPPPGLLELDA